jgi:CHAT domain-containing protein/tetratricopeptide (TPR) repeat protein
MGDYSEALPLYKEALAIREKALGKEHPDFAHGLNDLAGLYESMGDYSKALPLYKEALAIREKALGKEHPDYARTVINLAVHYHSMGDYAKALPLYKEALAIMEKALGKEHPDFARSLNNLAALYKSMEDYAKALPLYKEALAIREKALGKEHPDFAHGLNNLAALYDSMGDYEKALPLYEEALAIMEKALGKEHPEYAMSLGNLASLYTLMGDYAKAMPLYIEVLAIHETSLGKGHPAYATGLSSLAALYKSMGDYAKARPLYNDALAIMEKALGKEHPEYAVSLSNLAAVYHSIGDYVGARPLDKEAVMLTSAHLVRTAAVQTEQQQLAFVQSLAHYLDSYLTASHQTGGHANEAFSAVLTWKGSTLVRQRAMRLAADDPKLKPTFGQLQSVTRQWAALAHQAQPTDEPQVANFRQRRAELEAQRERLELELSRLSADFHQATQKPKLKDLQDCLPSDAALVDYLEYNQRRWVKLPQQAGIGVVLEPDGMGAKVVSVFADGTAARDGRLRVGDLIVAIADGDGEWQSSAGLELNKVVDRLKGAADSLVRVRLEHETSEIVEITLARRALPYQKVGEFEITRSLLAFVVRPGHDVEMYDLGPSAPVIEHINVWRNSFGMSEEGKSAGEELREQLWEPLLPSLEGTNLVLVSPDGALGQLPFAALPGKEPESYLLEDHPLAMIPVPQLIPALVNEVGKRQLEKDLLLVGGVDYDGPAAATDAPQRPKRKRMSRGELDRAVGEQAWDPLPGAAAEVAFIADTYRRLFEAGDNAVVDLRAAQATEEAFRSSAPRCAVLHLATHGYFASPDKESAIGVSTRGERFRQLGEAERERLRGFSPGLLSGLVFAGANNPPPDGDARDDGLMTASEIAVLPLSGVRLVMLSACETGLGEVAGGEGLLGVQRAFQVAGARSTVATLWKVDDLVTRRIMERFYTGYLDEELSPLDALREAQLWALKHPDELRGVNDPDDSQASAKLSPRYWAAYVFSGDWRGKTKNLTDQP